MHLGEPQYGEYERPDAEPEHNDNHLAKPKIPVSVNKVRGNGCHQVDISNNREGKQRQPKNCAHVPSDPRMQQCEPTDLCNEDRRSPEAPPSKCWIVRSVLHIEC